MADRGTIAGEDDIWQLRSALHKVARSDTKSRSVAPDPQWRSSWSDFAELGITGLCVPEERGGSGFEVGAAVATARELAAVLHGSPFAGLTASAVALSRSDHPAARAIVEGLLTGERVCAFGLIEGPGRTTQAVDGAPDADAFVLLDRSSGELVLADSSTAVTRTDPAPFDVSRSCGTVTVDPAEVVPIGHGPTVPRLFGLLLAADTLGCVERMLARTVEYAGQRQAFGRLIGGFQAVQHRLVDHAVQLRGMALAVEEAARRLGASSADAARRVGLAEISVSARAVHMLHDMVQLTGAIGFTWEYGLHFYERRAQQDARLAANPRAASLLVADLEGWTHADGG